MNGTRDLLAAFLRRDMRDQLTYRLSLLTQGLFVVLSVVSLAYLARLVPATEVTLRPYDGDYFTFILVGTAASTFITVGLGGFSDSLSREQAAGTLEALLVTPNDPRTLIVLGGAFAVMVSAVELALYLLIGAVFFSAHIPLGHLLIVLVMELLAVAAFSAVGLLTAAILVIAKRGGGLIGLVNASFGIIGGVLYPITVMPNWLQVIAHLLPVTYGLDGVRRALADRVDVPALAGDAAALTAFAAGGLPIAIWVYGRSVARARREGSLTQY